MNELINVSKDKRNLKKLSTGKYLNSPVFASAKNLKIKNLCGNTTHFLVWLVLNNSYWISKFELKIVHFDEKFAESRYVNSKLFSCANIPHSKATNIRGDRD